MMIALVVLWLAAASAVVGLAVYRNLVAHYEEDDKIHLREVDTAVVAHQASVSHRLELADKWGKTLTVSIVVFGILLAAVYLYQQWIVSNEVIH